MLGYESEVVNGQLVNVAPAPAYDPIIFGAMYTGPGAWPRQGVYNVPPVIPSASSMVDMAPASYGGAQVTTAAIPTTSSASGNPFHLTKSPVMWAIALLVISLLMLHYVHFGR
jgi:hypothetical protein